MKASLMVVLLFANTMAVWGGPSSPGSFTPSITRQDFTGQGTYHRQGLIREQNRALSTRPPAESSRKTRPCFLEKIWTSLFQKKSARTVIP